MATGEEIPDAVVVDVEGFDAGNPRKLLAYLTTSAKFEGVKLIAVSPTE